MTHLKGIGIFAVGLGMLACSHSVTEPSRELPVVRIQSAVSAVPSTGIRYAAVVRANRQVELDFKLAGYVRQLGRAKKSDHPLQEGDTVAAGAVLASLDPADYLAKTEAARAAVLEAKVAKDQALRDQNRATDLAADNVVPQAQLERSTTQADLAIARLSRAQATLHEAELAVADTALKAPFAGTILSRLVEQGAFVTPRTPGFVLADTTRMKIVFGVPDVIAQTTRLGQLATVEVPSIGKTIQAPVSRISPSADLRSRLFELEVMLPNESDELKVGLAATVVLAPQAGVQPGELVPLRALVNGDSKQSDFAVFVLEPDGAQSKVRARPVQVTAVVGDNAVLTGIEHSDRIVSLGASLLHDGDRVRVAP